MGPKEHTTAFTLTPSEVRMLTLMHLPAGTVAKQFQLSPSTIQNLRKKIYAKTGKTRLQLCIAIAKGEL